MRAFLSPLLRWFRPDAEASGDVLASLILAAREDGAMRERLIFVLRLLRAQREPLVQTAVAEMRLRGEPVVAQQAFARLADEAEARMALRLLGE